MFTPIIAVRNIGKDASSVTGNIPYTINGKTDRIRLSELSLSPGEIGFLVAPIGWRRISAASAGLEVEYSGEPGSVIASVISVSQSGDKVFPLMMKDPEAVASSSGGYPWFAEDDYSSVVYIKNVTDKPQTFVLDVKYRQGMWGSGLKTVPPGETYVFDVKQARDNQIKGSEGNTIPLDAENGHIYWTIYGTIEKGLIGRSEAIYAYGGMAQTYECQPCPCPASTNSCMLEPPSLIGIPGDSAQFSYLQRTYNCHGAYGSWFPVSVNNFTSDNPSVASISSGGFSSALSPGTAHFSASAPAQVNYWNGFGCATQYINAAASAVCDVQCSIPTGETFMSTGWGDAYGIPTAAVWVQTLTPTTTNFAGRTVFETDPGGGSDGCHFSDSIFDEMTSCCDPINPDTWLVESGNKWQPDLVGWIPVGVNYYREARLTRGLQLPCQFTFPQRMVINCGTLGNYSPYVTTTLVGVIDVTTVSSGRNINFVTREWFP